MKNEIDTSEFPSLQSAVQRLQELGRDDSLARKSDLAEVGLAVIEAVSDLLRAHHAGRPLIVNGIVTTIDEQTIEPQSTRLVEGTRLDERGDG